MKEGNANLDIVFLLSSSFFFLLSVKFLLLLSNLDPARVGYVIVEE